MHLGNMRSESGAERARLVKGSTSEDGETGDWEANRGRLNGCVSGKKVVKTTKLLRRENWE